MIRIPDSVIEASARANLQALSQVIEGEPTTMLAGPISFVSPWS